MKKNIKPTIRNVQRILDFLGTEKKLVSISYLVSSLGIEYYSCFNALAFLENLGQVQKFSSNHTTLYSLKKPAEVIQNATANITN